MATGNVAETVQWTQISSKLVSPVCYSYRIGSDLWQVRDKMHRLRVRPTSLEYRHPRTPQPCTRVEQRGIGYSCMDRLALHRQILWGPLAKRGVNLGYL